MSWILGGIYCGIIWLVFAKLKLIRLSLPIAIVLASAGPSMIIALLFCAQYLHPFTPNAVVLERVDPISVQLTRPGRVTEVLVEPNVPVQEGDVLFKVDPIPYRNAVQQREVALAQAKQNVELAQSSVVLAEANQKRATADLDYATKDRDRQAELRESNAASQQELELAQTRYEQASAAFSQSEENLKQTVLSVEVAKADVAASETALDNAKYDLEQTSVLAPANGYVTNLQLREGLLVSASSGPVMTFVRDEPETGNGVVVAMFAEKNYLLIKPEQYAEIAMAGYPGQILKGRVINTIDVSGAGQLDATGQLPTTVVDGTPTSFAVRIQLDDASLRLPGGARGQVAIYTDNMQIAGIPVMFLIRGKSWLNYLF
ncbi:MAG TPA: HlyD family secretion protein [Planctomycetaceae bacterium]|nr:HlyD family secretion protein [Planctomycetaceae bacterium]